MVNKAIAINKAAIEISRAVMADTLQAFEPGYPDCHHGFYRQILSGILFLITFRPASYFSSCSFLRFSCTFCSLRNIAFTSSVTSGLFLNLMDKFLLPRLLILLPLEPPPARLLHDHLHIQTSNGHSCSLLLEATDYREASLTSPSSSTNCEYLIGSLIR